MKDRIMNKIPDNKRHRLYLKTEVELRDAMGNIKFTKELPPNIGIDKSTRRNKIDAYVYSKDGVIVKEFNDMPMNSFVSNYLRSVVAAYYNNATGVQIRFMNGDYGTTGMGDFTMAGSYAGVGLHAGINVGTGAGGNAAVNALNYNLDGFIYHGNAAGQLYKGAGSYASLPTVDGNYYRFSFQRTFTNNSGNTINIKNVGLFHYSSGGSSADSATHMDARDILDHNGNPINIELANTQSVQFVYTFYNSFTEGLLRAYSALEFAFRAYNGALFQFYDIEGDANNVNLSSISWNCFGVANNSSYGFVVGSGATTPLISDYKMDVLIPHGTGAGQMVYAAQSVEQVAVTTGQTTSCIMSRSFLNNSGSDQTVREFGIVHQHNSPTSRLLGLRKLTGNILVVNGAPITFRQTWAVVTT